MTRPDKPVIVHDKKKSFSFWSFGFLLSGLIGHYTIGSIGS
jgi:hypothetical protein